MGISYHGPYADEVNYDAFHEGYAARLWRDGSLTASWGGEYGWTGHTGLVGACECGWRSQAVHGPGEYDSPAYRAAEHDFETQHLDPLIAAAKQRSWPQWSRRAATHVTKIADLVQQGHFDDARDILDSLRNEVDRQAGILAELHAEREFAEHAATEQPARHRSFVAINETTAAASPRPGTTTPPTAPSTARSR